MEYVEPIRDKRDVWNVADYLKKKNEKYYILFVLGCYSGLRVSDILKLRVRDIRGRESVVIYEQKTKKRKSFPINREIRRDIEQYCKDKPASGYLIPADKAPGHPVCRSYVYRMIREAGEYYGLDHLGTHTMRKTFGYHFYNQTGDVATLQRIFNHHDEKTTLRYIGIEQEHIDKVMEKFTLK